MGDGCKPKNLAAITMAYHQAKGSDLFSEAQRLNEMDFEQRAFYEKYMSKELGKKSSALEAIKKKTGKNSPSFFEDRLYAHPSEQFSKKFYGAIDNKISTWAKNKKADLNSYRKEVAPEIRKVLKAVDKIVLDERNSTPKVLNQKLKPLGLTAETVYDARGYLQWLASGGHLSSQGDASPFLNQAGNIAKAQANLNFLWSMGNGVDMLRPYAHYATRQNGLKNIVKGTLEAIKASKGNLFKKLPDLEKQGVYQTSYADRGGSGFLNPFEWSINAQKNLVYHLDKTSGGDGLAGIREQLFDYKPWDRPRSERFQGAGLVFGLARYPINESRWIFKTTKEALSGDKRQAANLGVYYLTRAAATGTAAQIPSFVWSAMPKDMKETIKEFDAKNNLNLVKIISTKALNQIGIDAEVDLTEYLQPFGGSLGSRAAQLASTGQGALSSGVKSVVNLSQGKYSAAAINSLATATALANFGVFASIAKGVNGKAGGLDKFVELAENFEQSPLNSTTITKMLKVLGKELEQEFNQERLKTNVVKAIFGQGNVKKAK